MRNRGERIKIIVFFLKSLVKRKESEKQRRKKKKITVFSRVLSNIGEVFVREEEGKN